MPNFFARFLANPSRVGAIAPSSASLARAMAATTDISGNVLELGPGSGVFTAALLKRGLPPQRLTVIEYDETFTTALRRKFPAVCVLQGDAFEFKALIGDMRFSSVVSGLPLLNYPKEKGSALIADALARGATYVQFSYGWNAPVPAPEHATVKLAARIWRNLPPAAVWVYSSLPPAGTLTSPPSP